MIQPRHFLVPITSAAMLTAVAQQAMQESSAAGSAAPTGISVCRMLVAEEGRTRESGQGGQKAEVFRYRQPARPVKPVHSISDDTTDETGEGDGEEKTAAPALSANDLRVLPNPSDGLFTLAFPLPENGGNGQLYVTDAAGRVVHREVVLGSGGQARTIDLRGQGPGTYIATIVVGDNTISKRLVIDQAAAGSAR
jgi:hypothetical protein